MITRRENLKMTLNRHIPKWMPFSVNFNQWYLHHKKFKSLPSYLSLTDNYIEAMKVLDCDVFSRNVDDGFRQTYSSGMWIKLREEITVGFRGINIAKTPYGDLH